METTWRVSVTQKQTEEAPVDLILRVIVALANEPTLITHKNIEQNTTVYEGKGQPPHCLMELAYLGTR